MIAVDAAARPGCVIGASGHPSPRYKDHFSKATFKQKRWMRIPFVCFFFYMFVSMIESMKTTHGFNTESSHFHCYIVLCRSSFMFSSTQATVGKMKGTNRMWSTIEPIAAYLPKQQITELETNQTWSMLEPDAAVRPSWVIDATVWSFVLGGNCWHQLKLKKGKRNESNMINDYAWCGGAS